MRNKEAEGTKRLFAFCEIVCFPLSWLSLLALLGQTVLALCGYKEFLPNWLLTYVLPLLLSGAIGYLTNWIAIMMLFRPYEPKKWLRLLL